MNKLIRLNEIKLNNIQKKYENHYFNKKNKNFVFKPIIVKSEPNEIKNWSWNSF